MYGDNVKRKKLREVERLMEKSSRYERKAFRAFPLHDEAVRAAQAPSVSLPNSPRNANSASPSSSSISRDAVVVASLDNLPRPSRSPSLELDVLLDTDAKEDVTAVCEADSSIVLDSDSDDVVGAEWTGETCESFSIPMTPVESMERSPRAQRRFSDLFDDSQEDETQTSLRGANGENGVSPPAHREEDEDVTVLRAKRVASSPSLELQRDLTPPLDAEKSKSECVASPPTSHMASVVVPPIVGIPFKANESIPQLKCSAGPFTSSQDTCSIGSRAKVRSFPPNEPKAPHTSDSVEVKTSQSPLHPHVERPRPIPRDFDLYVKQGEAKRASQLEQSRAADTHAAEELRYRPQLSQFAERRPPRSVAAYVEDSQHWERRRRQRIAAIAARLESEEREEQLGAPRLNATSQRLVREMTAHQKRMSVAEHPEQHFLARQSRLEALRAKYTPSFQPHTLPTQSATQMANPNTKPLPAQKRHTAAERETQSVYERLSRYHEALALRRESRRRAEFEAQTLPPAPRRSEAQIAAHVHQLFARAETCRQSAERRAQREAAAEPKPRVNTRSAALAKRHRARQAENAKRAAAIPVPEKAETSRRLSFSPSKSRSPTRAFLSPEFEARNARLLEQRARRAAAHRRAEAERLARVCTFRPATNQRQRPRPSSSGGCVFWGNEVFKREAGRSDACVRRRETLAAVVAESLEDDLAWAEEVRHVSRQNGRQDAGSVSEGEVQRDEEDSLTAQIKGLEEMLSQWKMLEEEYRV